MQIKRKRHSTEENIRTLREGEALEAHRQGTAQMCQKLEISEQTLSRWKTHFRGMGDEEENRLRKNSVADLTLDKQILKEAQGEKTEPGAARAASVQIQRMYGADTVAPGVNVR